MVKLFDPLLTPAVKLNQTPAGAYAIEEDQRQQETEQAQAALRDSRNGESSSADLLGTTYLTPMPGVVSADPAVLKADFREFLKAIWAYLRLPPPTQLQLDIAYWLQHSPDRAVLMGFRGVAKSWITAAYALWLLYCDPQKRVLVVSASLRKAVNFVTFCLDLIRSMPLLQHMEPGLKQRQSAQGFDVQGARPDQNASLSALGITGQLNGPRADEIVADDIETSSNSMTVTMRDKIKDGIREFDAIIKPGGKIKYLGTPQTEDSIYNVLPKRGYVVRIYPSEYPTHDRQKRQGPRLAEFILDAVRKDPRLIGHTTEPTRFPDDDLAKRKLAWGSSGYALQFLLDTSLSDADRYPLKLKNLIVTPLDWRKAPEIIAWGNDEKLIFQGLQSLGFEGDHFYKPASASADRMAPYTEIVGGLDTSGRGSNETSLTIGAELHAMVYCLFNGGWRDGYAPETLKAISKACVDYNVMSLLIESNFGDGIFAELLRPYIEEAWKKANEGRAPELRGGTTIVEERASNQAQKEKRILSVLEPITQQHRLVMSSEVIQADYESLKRIDGEETRMRYSLIYQFTHLTHEKDCLVLDDRLESLAIMGAHFAPRLGVNPLGMAEKAQEQREEDEIERLFRTAAEIGGEEYRGGSNRARAARIHAR